MVAWPTVCRPTTLGGLGVADLKLAGIALQSRWLWLQRTDQGRAWSALEIKVDPQVEDFFRASTVALIGNGHRIKFWLDPWINGASVPNLAPNLFKSVPARIRSRRTVAQAVQQHAWTRDASGELNENAIQELNTIWNHVQEIQLEENIEDNFRWNWEASGQYSVKSAYLALHTGSTHLHGADLIWKAWAPLKVKIFLWLTLLRRNWTADRRIRHGLQSHTKCLLCDQEDETTEHILIQCSYSIQIWWSILQRLGYPSVTPGTSSVQDWWLHLRGQLLSSKRQGFDSLFALIA
ncbi:hypothetical protein HU200_055900 [Digitaria exilis]|uniref:Reverse transcriptase zinc-binding domain-containing protein n=1 Tax=Digitaria exilis TaxID=1010633 RepID=A0A835ANP8_9POAL|nr:hypothetical protein HU200_055900 [Digitaria exilis]